MLLKHSQSLTLKEPARKILCFSVACHNTFVFVKVDRPGQSESLVHVDTEGNVLFQFTYNSIIDMFGMLSDREVIVLDVHSSKIDIFDLEKQTVCHIAHLYLFDDVAQMEIITFFNHKYFAVVEHGSYNDHKLRLTYYDFQEISELVKKGKVKENRTTEKNQEISEVSPISGYESDGGDWTYECPIKKANNHSMIAWFKIQHQQQIVFYTWDLREAKTGRLTQIQIKNTIGQQYISQTIEITLSNLWESTPDIFTLVCRSNKEEINAVNQAGVINDIYVLDRKMNILRESKFWFKDAKTGFCWNNRLLITHYLGSVSVFYTFNFKNGNPLDSPVYYVNNQTEEIIAQETWKASSLVKFFVPGFDNAGIVWAQHLNGDVKQVEVTYKKVMDQKEISLHFLLHLNEDFDDDLLKDAIDLIHSE